MMDSPVETLFNLIDQTAEILEEELSCTYLEAIAETGENLFHEDVLQSEVSEVTKKRLKKQYAELNIESYTSEDIRKGLQLAILKGMKQNIQPNHQMTPDSIGMFMSYLVGKFMVNQKEFSLLDPALGTGNLLTTILNQLPFKKVSSVGVEIDDLLLKLAYVGANLQKHPIELFNQDSLEPLFIDPVDAVVCDLPIGFYPNDVRALDYQLCAEKGHTFAHHLFIEQSIKHTKPGGYLFFIIPNGLFESEQSDKLHPFLKEHANIQAIIQLPESLFRNENSAKSILVLQKQKPDLKAPREILLAKLPSLSNQTAMENMMNQMNTWFKENK
ncbi:class I SAM-dependent methyltransferase [Rossellomorea sp. BNER]|uniref:class I SAM-dependent methyltransferase n=1 Tax=Rossellomorea sp. BNER TaxID=2962031 RepID=UPI003AF205C5|nr:class I SAM-dependent methyltransferase [Rossellomorea sp. BNER]